MPEALVEPDVEQALVDYVWIQLLGLGDGAKVASRLEEGRSVRITQTGGTVVDRVLVKAQLMLACYDTLETRASGLLRLVSGIVLAIDNVTVGDVLLYSATAAGGIGNSPDPLDQRTRYQRLVEVNARAIGVPLI